MTACMQRGEESQKVDKKQKRKKNKRKTEEEMNEKKAGILTLNADVIFLPYK